MSLTCLWLVCFEGPVVIFHCSSECQTAKVEEQHEAKGAERRMDDWQTSCQQGTCDQVQSIALCYVFLATKWVTKVTLTWRNRWTLQKVMGTPRVICLLKPLITSVTRQHSFVLWLPVFVWLTFSGWRKLVLLYSFRVQLCQSEALRVTFLTQIH